MWITRREWARHQRELQAALKRARHAEDALAAERQAKDWLVLQLASRVITKHGGYGLDHEAPSVEVAPHPQRFTHEPTEADMAKLDYYRECYRQVGKTEEEADAIWEAEMRGEMPRYPYEELEAEQ